MSAAKHTPGPWGRIVELGCDVYAISKDPESHTFVAECAIEEDARFIAAAPAMYEAIKATLDRRAKDYLDNSIEPYSLLVQALAQAEGK